MDIQHLKYAVEVEKYKSISRAAEKLYISQPFLSKAIRELEADVGIDIFNRTPRGVVPTKKGQDFLAGAREVIAEFDSLESSYKSKRRDAYRFEITVPIACYISQAFVEFMRELDGSGQLKVDYRETNTLSTINHVAEHDSSIGIIRYPTDYEDHFLRRVESRDLIAKPIWEFEYHLIMSKLNPLARQELIDVAELDGLIEISHGDPTVPGLPAAAAQELKRRSSSSREIVVYERQSQFELLCAIPETYMWASPTPPSVFATYPLVQKDCTVPGNRYKDAFIYRRGYRLTPEDRLFVRKVNEMVGQLQR